MNIDYYCSKHECCSFDVSDDNTLILYPKQGKIPKLSAEILVSEINSAKLGSESNFKSSKIKGRIISLNQHNHYGYYDDNAKQ